MNRLLPALLILGCTLSTALAEGEPKTLKGHSDGVNAIALSPDGKRLATGSSDDLIILWDVRSHTFDLAKAIVLCAIVALIGGLISRFTMQALGRPSLCFFRFVLYRIVSFCFVSFRLDLSRLYI